MDTPSERLASKIIDRMIASKLFAPDDRVKLLSKLAEGKMRAEDWRLAIELAPSRVKKK